MFDFRHKVTKEILEKKEEKNWKEQLF
jgi:hypothetical protein